MLVKEPEGSFERHPEGSFAAVCTRIVDVGDQPIPQRFLKPGQHPYNRKMIIQWETEELMDDGRPFTIIQWYTRTLGAKGNLRPALESWRGKSFTGEELRGFRLDSILGTGCMLQVIHDVNEGGREIAKISAIMSLKKDKWPKPVEEPFFFDLDAYDKDAYNRVGEYWQGRIEEGRQNMLDQEKPNGALEKAAEERKEEGVDPDDPVPF